MSERRPPNLEEFSRYGEPLLPQPEQEELNSFRRRLARGEELSEEERQRFLELQRKEEEAKQERYG